MMKEREDFYRGLSEIEELKKSLSEMVAEDEAREREEGKLIILHNMYYSYRIEYF